MCVLAFVAPARNPIRFTGKNLLPTAVPEAGSLIDRLPSYISGFFLRSCFFVIFFFSTYLFRSAPFISSGMDETSRSHWIPTEKW